MIFCVFKLARLIGVFGGVMFMVYVVAALFVYPDVCPCIAIHECVAPTEGWPG